MQSGNRASTRFDRTIDQKLIKAIRNGKCILFAGAGLSAQVTSASTGQPLPNWKQLLQEMLVWAKAQGIRFWGDPDEIKQMIEKGNLLMAAQELQERIAPAEMNKFFRQVFTGVRPSRVHRLLPAIPFRGILTTNYDTLLESAYVLENSGNMPNCYTQEDLLHVSSPLRTEDFFIFKIHGDISNQGTIILGSRNYQDLLFRTPGYRQFLETLFAINTVLFVGFGGTDPDLDNLLDRLASIYSRTLDRDYILLPDERFNDSEKRRLALDKMLEVIEYRQEHDGDHSQVEAFLRELRVMVDVSYSKSRIPDYSQGRLRVFISAAHEDSEQVIPIVRWLRENGFAPWTAYEKLNQLNWNEDIVSQGISQALDNADCIIVIYTPRSIYSDQVNSEVQVALSNEARGRVALLPIVYGTLELPSFLQGRNYIRYGAETRGESIFGQLLRWLQEIERLIEARQYQKFDVIPEKVLANKVAELMEQFAGQRVPGIFVGLPDETISLPSFTRISRERNDGRLLIDVLGEGEQTWVVEIKRNVTDQKRTINQLREYSYRFEASIVWLITAAPLSPNVRARFAESNILTSTFEGIEQLSHLLNTEN